MLFVVMEGASNWQKLAQILLLFSESHLSIARMHTTDQHGDDTASISL